MIFTWVWAIIVILAAIAAIIFSAIECDTVAGKVVAIGVSVVLAAVLAGGPLWWLYNTESGSRAIKSFQSDISGGLSRTVTVYDINGIPIKQYSGDFDVQYDSSRIIFDDESGKRHVIYYTTGTVIIDEN